MTSWYSLVRRCVVVGFTLMQESKAFLSFKSVHWASNMYLSFSTNTYNQPFKVLWKRILVLRLNSIHDGKLKKKSNNHQNQKAEKCSCRYRSQVLFFLSSLQWLWEWMNESVTDNTHKGNRHQFFRCIIEG